MRDSPLLLSSQFQGDKKMRMTAQQKADYKLYRKECRLSGVEPVRKDFLAGDIPSCVIVGMEQARLESAQERAMSAAAGR
jgi:hypothetical protein